MPGGVLIFKILFDYFFVCAESRAIFKKNVHDRPLLTFIKGEYASYHGR